MSVSNVQPVRRDTDAAFEREASYHEAIVVEVERGLDELAKWEALFGDEDSVAHYARSLAASLRCVRNTHNSRAAMLRALLHEGDVPGWIDEPLGSRKA